MTPSQNSNFKVIGESTKSETQATEYDSSISPGSDPSKSSSQSPVGANTGRFPMILLPMIILAIILFAICLCYYFYRKKAPNYDPNNPRMKSASYSASMSTARGTDIFDPRKQRAVDSVEGKKLPLEDSQEKQARLKLKPSDQISAHKSLEGKIATQVGNRKQTSPMKEKIVSGRNSSRITAKSSSKFRSGKPTNERPKSISPSKTPEKSDTTRGKNKSNVAKSVVAKR